MSTTDIQCSNGATVAVPTGLFIKNEFVPSVDGSTIDVLNPYDEHRIAVLAAATDKDVDVAVKAAEEAFYNQWRVTRGTERAALLARLADLIQRDAEKFATIEAIDAGILFAESRHLNVQNAIDTLRYFASICTRAKGQLLDIPEGYAYTLHEPYGVTAAIVPWNAPLMITTWKLAAAIAAGNVLIIKTPELAPLYGQKLAELIVEAGFPAGVVQILCGLGTSAGKALAEHMRIRKLAFTGSSATGRSLLHASANSNLKKVSLELGGKGPTIVFEDARLDNAVLWAQIGSSANNGQICALGSRIYVHENIHDAFVKAFKERMATNPTKKGDPLSPDVTKGPIISRQQYERVVDKIRVAKEEGATALIGGDTDSAKGNFVDNTIFTNVREDMTIVKEEVFGPVATIATFKTEAEVIAKANDSELGLNAAIFTENTSRAYRVSKAIEVGTVTVNCWAVLSPNTPFGGVKQSGFGRDMGEDALHEWTTIKSVKHMLLPEQAKL